MGKGGGGGGGGLGGPINISFNIFLGIDQTLSTMSSKSTHVKLLSIKIPLLNLNIIDTTKYFSLHISLSQNFQSILPFKFELIFLKLTKVLLKSNSVFPVCLSVCSFLLFLFHLYNLLRKLI
jgi:hypothetical protein